MNESEFKKHISSGEHLNLYLIYGDEKMLVRNMTERFLNRLAGDERNEFNFHEFDDESRIEDISFACDVMPFMSPLNIVVIKDMDFDNLRDGAEDFDALMNIIGNIPDTTVLIFYMPTLLQCKGKRFSKVKGYIEKHGIAVNISPRPDLGIEKILTKWARDGGCKMSELTANKLIKYVGNDLNTLHSELEKLVAYADGDVITEDMVKLLVSEKLEARIFDLFDYIIAKNSDKALKALNILFDQREEPIAIVIILGYSYIDAYRIRVVRESGVSLDTFAQDFKYTQRWKLDKISKQTKDMQTRVLRESIDEIISSQQKLVSSSADSKIEAEKLISKLIILAGTHYE